MLRSIATLAVCLLLGLAGYALYGHWNRHRPEPLDPYRREAARLVADEIVGKIRVDNDLDGPVLMLPLAGDKGEDEVSDMLRAALDDAGRYRLIAPGVLFDYLEAEQKSRDSLRDDPAAIAKAAATLGADGLLTGKIIRFPAPRGHDKTEIELSLALHGKDGGLVFEERYRASVEPNPFSLAYWRATIAGVGGWTRFLAWLGFVLLLPAALVPLIKKALARESNATNAWLLLGQTAAGAFAAFVALELRIDGAFDALALLVATVATAMFNFLATSTVEYLR